MGVFLDPTFNDPQLAAQRAWVRPRFDFGDSGLGSHPGTAWAGILLGFVAGLLSLLTLVSVLAA